MKSSFDLTKSENVEFRGSLPEGRRRSRPQDPTQESAGLLQERRRAAVHAEGQQPGLPEVSRALKISNLSSL